jgi:hypothetical protein
VRRRSRQGRRRWLRQDNPPLFRTLVRLQVRREDRRLERRRHRLGFSREELRLVLDHRMLEMLRRANQWARRQGR